MAANPTSGRRMRTRFLTCRGYVWIPLPDRPICTKQCQTDYVCEREKGGERERDVLMHCDRGTLRPRQEVMNVGDEDKSRGSSLSAYYSFILLFPLVVSVIQSKVRPKNKAVLRSKIRTLLGLLDTEDEGTTSLQNVGKYLKTQRHFTQYSNLHISAVLNKKGNVRLT